MWYFSNILTFTSNQVKYSIEFLYFKLFPFFRCFYKILFCIFYAYYL